jgi:hypothetical protein
MKIIEGIPAPASTKSKIDEFVKSTKPGDMIQLTYMKGLIFVNRLRNYANTYHLDLKVKTKRSDCKEFLNIWRVS